MFSACLRLGLHKLAFAVASLCVDPAVVRSHAVWVYTDTSALETYEHTSYTVPHIVNRTLRGRGPAATLRDGIGLSFGGGGVSF